MRIPQSDEYLGIINDLLKTQNRRVNKHLAVAADGRQAAKAKYTPVADRFAALARYVSETLLPEVELNTKPHNQRYIFNYIEDFLPENHLKYFKIIITNKIKGETHFIVVSYDFRQITVKIKAAASDEPETEAQVFPLEKFTNGKIRRIFFEYFQSIIELDTMPKYRAPRTEPEPVAENPSLVALNIEVERMRLVAERNQQMLLEANAKKMALKQKMETEKQHLLNDEQTATK